MIKQFQQGCHTRLLFLLCILVLVGSDVSAERIQTTPIRTSPLSPKIQEMQPVVVPAEIPEEQKGAAPPALKVIRPEPGLSLIEQYVSGVIEITGTQYEMLKLNDKLSLSYEAPLPRAGRVSVLVRALKRPLDTGEKPTEVFAGYLTGSPDDIADAFRVLDIRSNYAVIAGIRQFGYDLFEKPPSTFAPAEKVPVGPGYVIAPGDEIRVTVWGKIEGKWDVVVDRDGNIALPKVGILGVTGLTFEELKSFLYKEFSQYYSGFDMNVSMGTLRTIQLYMVGNARKPGAYTISSLSTLVNALFEAGGPSKTGTMRDIQVKRNGKTVVRFDMYDFLLKGDKTKDIRLMPEDVVFIPPVGEQASIAGSVRNPAIYELKGETSALDLIEMAGGLSDIAFNGRLQVERIVDKSRQIVFEADIPQAGEIKLQGGDVVKIFSIVEDRRTVRVSGAVHREGEYGFSPGMTVRDLVSLSGGLKYYAFDEEAELTRVKVTNKGPVTEKIRINLMEALRGETGSNLPLMENDYLFVRMVPEWRLYRKVSITGEIRFPGDYTIEKGETLSSLIERAGGFTDNAYLEGATLTRESARKRQQKTIDEMMDRLERELMSVGAAESATALSAEEATIQKIEIEQKRRFIEALRDAKAKGRVVVRLLPPDQLRETPYDIALEEGDSIHIPEDPEMVYTTGAVYNQASFVYDKGKGVSDYIELSGGYTENADKKRAYVIKADGSAVKKGDADLESGDTIVIPEKLERVAWLRETKDITQILYQIAVTAGVLIVAF